MKLRHPARFLPGVLASGLIASGLTSCATVSSIAEPEAVSVELDHVSHASQHFGPTPTNYGYDAINLVIRWQHGPVYATLAEGAILEGPACGGQCYGAMWGPRELFTGQLGVNLWTK